MSNVWAHEKTTTERNDCSVTVFFSQCVGCRPEYMWTVKSLKNSRLWLDGVARTETGCKRSISAAINKINRSI